MATWQVKFSALVLCRLPLSIAISADPIRLCSADYYIKRKKQKHFSRLSAIGHGHWGECIGASRSLKFTQPPPDQCRLDFPLPMWMLISLSAKEVGKSSMTAGFIFDFPCGKRQKEIHTYIR